MIHHVRERGREDAIYGELKSTCNSKTINRKPKNARHAFAYLEPHCQ